MATGLGQTFRSSILNYILRGATSPALSTVYVSLHTADPGDDGQAGNELSGTNYARVAVSTAGGTNFSATTSANPSVLTNATTIAFPTAGGAWGTAAFFGLWNSSTLSGTSNFVGRGSLTASQAIISGNTPTFTAGNLTMTINIVNASAVDTGMSQAFRAALYDHIFRAGTDPLPNGTYTQLWIALHTADPGNTGTSEASGGGYARSAFNRTTSQAFAAATNGNPCTIANGNTAITFPTATTPGYNSGTGANTFWSLWRVSSSGTGADYILRGQMTSQIVVTGNSPSFGTGSGGALITRLDQT